MANDLDAKWTKAIDEYLARIKADFFQWQSHYFYGKTDIAQKQINEFNSKLRYEVAKKYIKVLTAYENPTKSKEIG